MMPFISLVAIIFSLFGQGLTFSAPHTWSFTGTVIETRQVFVMGMVSQVALVQSPDFDAWVMLIQRMESQSNELPEIVLGRLQTARVQAVAVRWQRSGKVCGAMGASMGSSCIVNLHPIMVLP